MARTSAFERHAKDGANGGRGHAPVHDRGHDHRDPPSGARRQRQGRVGEAMGRSAGVRLFTIERTITVTHYAAQKALVGEWVSLCTDEFREALMRAMDEGE